MRSVGVQQLKTHAGEILKRVQEEGEEVEITYRGHTIARLVPVEETQPSDGQTAPIWCDLDQLIQEMEYPWPDEAVGVDETGEA